MTSDTNEFFRTSDMDLDEVVTSDTGSDKDMSDNLGHGLLYGQASDMCPLISTSGLDFKMLQNIHMLGELTKVHI